MTLVWFALSEKATPLTLDYAQFLDIPLTFAGKLFLRAVFRGVRLAVLVAVN